MSVSICVLIDNSYNSFAFGSQMYPCLTINWTDTIKNGKLTINACEVID